MKLTGVKSMVIKGVTVGLVAGAVALAAPAQAQQFAVGVQFGSPSYGHHEDYYARQRNEELCRERAFAAQQAYLRQQASAQHEARERHEAWGRQQAFGRYGNGYRDRDRRDRDDRRDWDRR